MLLRFRLADSGKRFALHLFDQCVDALNHAFVLLLPVEVVIPCGSRLGSPCPPLQSRRAGHGHIQAIDRTLSAGGSPSPGGRTPQLRGSLGTGASLSFVRLRRCLVAMPSFPYGDRNVDNP